MYKKILFFMFCIALFTTMVSASTINIGDYVVSVEQDECFNIPFTCDNCTFSNITISYPNGTIIIGEGEMSSTNGFYYNYSFCNTSITGKYWVGYHYDEDGNYLYSDMDWFMVTPNGINLKQGESLLYIAVLFFLLCLLILSIFGAFNVEHYIGKFTMYWISHVLFVIWTFSVWQITEGFLIGFVGLGGIFYVLFMVSIIAMFPMIILSLAWIVWIHTATEEMKSMMERGMGEEEAWDRVGRKHWKW